VVADALLPTRSFDVACRRVLEYLQAVPLGGWAVTRVIDGRQVLLSAEGDGYPLPPGTSLPLTASLCHTMVEGTTPRIAPDVRAVPQYAEMAAAGPIDISAYVGTPIVSGDGRLFGTVSVQGHDAGDEYLRRAAAALAATVRRDDVLARLGGDEFGIIAVGASPDEAAALVGRAERALAEAGVSGSFGHAPYSIVTGFPGAWKAADEAMYEQKRRRRAGLSGTLPR
jgi:hypothetical protein